MNILNAFRTDDRGGSAVEFAMAAPILAVVLLGIASGWMSVNQVSAMRCAVKAGAGYVLKGGTDINAAKSAVLASWANAPKDATVNVTSQCTCGTAANACTSLCTKDSSVPQMSYAITATRYFEAPLLDLLQGKVSVTEKEVVRVR